MGSSVRWDPTHQQAYWQNQAAKPCKQCGHSLGASTHAGHQEYQPNREVALVNGELEIVETPHPRYRPGLFACKVEGCDCEVQK